MRRADEVDRRPAAHFAFLFAVALVGGCAQTAIAPAGSDPIEAAFVVLGVDGQAVARVITRAAQCPVLTVDDDAQPMTVRAAAATVPQRPTRSVPAESKPSAFPVLVCDALLGARAIRASVGSHALPVPRPNPRRIVVIGDTGCRLKRSDAVFQSCNEPKDWPFADVAASAAAAKPDLVIHVGDYLYRENACPAGNADCAGSPWGYGWDAWNADFFTPARPLLAVAPWIVVRGNHESCDRGGQGWWRFLDPRPLAARRDCNDPADDVIGDFSGPYAVPISPGTQLLVFDSSRVGVDPIPATDPMYRTYTAQIREALALADRRAGTHNLFLDHHPILAFAPNPRTVPTSVYPGNASLQSVLQPINGDLLFPRSVDAVLSGHVHLFEAVSFATPHPPQIVSGNSGTATDAPLPRVLPSGATPAPGAVVESIVSTNRSGYQTLERDADVPGVWQVEAHDGQGRLFTTCVLREGKVRCTPEALQ
jgi:hypothetical protein